MPTLNFLDELVSDFRKYSDYTGLLQNRENPDPQSTGNGLLYTAHGVRLFKHLGQMDLARVTANKAIRSMTIVPGLFWAKLGTTEGQSIDNYTGAISMAAACGFHGTIDSIRQYANRTWWFFDVENPYKRFSGAYLGRFLTLRGQLDYAEHKDANALTPPLIASSGILNPRNQDEWFLSWHVIETYRDSGIINPAMETAISIWKYRFKLTWNDLGEVASIYWNKDHPCAKWLSLIDVDKI